MWSHKPICKVRNFLKNLSFKHTH